MRPCPRCGASVAETFRYCSSCGYDMQASQPATPEPQAPVTPPPASAPAASPWQPPSAPAPTFYEQAPQPQAPQYTPPAYTPPSQPYMPQTGYTAPRPPTTPSEILPGLLGSSADPSTVHPTNAVQQSMLKNLPQFATNPIAGAVIGAVAALLSCIILTFVLTLFISSSLASALNGASGSSLSGGFGDFVSNTLTSNILYFVALEHHIPLALTASASLSSASGSGSITFGLPLMLWVIIPAACLMFGGYISSATDYSNQVKFVLGRAAAVGPVYGVLLALTMALFGTKTASGGAFGADISVSFGPSWPWALLYGVVFGTIFGMLGGMVKFFSWRWRPGMVALLTSQRRSPVISGLFGAIAAVGLGILLMIPLFLFFMGTGTTSSAITNALINAHPTAAQTSAQNAQYVFLGLFSLPISIWFLAFASGGSLSSAASGFIPSLSSGSSNQSVSLFSAQIPHTFLLVMLVPAIAYFYGGRVAARLSGAPDQNSRMQAGLVMGAFSAVIMFLLAYVSGISVDTELVGQTAANVNAGPDLGPAFLGTLVFGCVFGAIGAALYAPKATAPRPAGNFGLFALFDRLAQQPAGQPRGAARSLLYWAGLVAIIMGALAIAIDFTGGLLVRSLDYTKLMQYLGYAGGAMLALPVLFLVLALATDLASTPPDSATLLQAVAVAPPTAPPPFAPPSAPYQYPSAPAQGAPMPPQMPPTTPPPSY